MYSRIVRPMVRFLAPPLPTHTARPVRRVARLLRQRLANIILDRRTLDPTVRDHGRRTLVILPLLVDRLLAQRLASLLINRHRTIIQQLLRADLLVAWSE